jgi:hypothetical protein
MSNTFSDKNGADVGPVDFNLTLGRKNAASVRSFALSNEDKTALDALVTAAQDTATDSPVAVHTPADVINYVPLLDTDWIDYANNSICCFKGPTAPQLLLEGASGTKDVYAVCILDAGTPTFAVGDLMFKLGVLQA